MDVLNETQLPRRTFAIISHPDAGKTTLTEKLLLYGGAIRQAGSVKARKAERYATSDWMEIEKQRGISVTSSVMQFDYDDIRINILDTPGHQDFSEDTYRTLVAADSAVMLIDGARGVEEQTIKLFHVCRMRGIPIFTFVNKMDRAAKDPFDLMSELESVLGISAYPMNWPIGILGDFKGIYHRDTKQIEAFHSQGTHGSQMITSTRVDFDDGEDFLGETYYGQLKDEVELLEAAGEELDMELIAAGQLTPMFFGSAMNNVGVQSFLEHFLQMSPSPSARSDISGNLDALRQDFSGFVFKIQANMNPAHRDRIAFMRICSGKFTRGMEVKNNLGKPLRLSQPQQFMAQSREMVEEAYPGDIIGLFDPGIFRLGDTLYTGEPVEYEGIPLFAPEHFARISTLDSMKRKQFIKGVTELGEEGAIQIFKELDISRESVIAGVVGVLQFEVLEYRLKNEYGVDIRLEQQGFRFIRWVGEGDSAALRLASSSRRAEDIYGRPVVLFENSWSIDWALENNPGLRLLDVMPRA